MIPHFKSTQEAIEFGKEASEDDIRIILKIREMALKVFHRLMKINTFYVDKDYYVFDQCYKFATLAQFMREAIEASEGRV